MFTRVCLFILCSGASIAAASWSSILQQYECAMQPAAYALLTAQQHAYQQGTSPKIADPGIKSIPIVESHEPLVDCRLAQHPRIAMLPDPSAPFRSPDCNSGFSCASQVRQEVYNRLVAMVGHLDTLAPAFGYQPGQVDIHVFEGLRDFATQKMLFDNKLKEIGEANPGFCGDEAFAETCKWVSPVVNNVPVHSTGGAVDIRAWDNYMKQFVDVGKFGVIWGANPTAPTFSPDIPHAQKMNRLYVLAAAAQAGLTNYAHEHWHFSCHDRYHVYWNKGDQENQCAHYDMVKKDS